MQNFPMFLNIYYDRKDRGGTKHVFEFNVGLFAYNDYGSKLDVFDQIYYLKIVPFIIVIFWK